MDDIKRYGDGMINMVSGEWVKYSDHIAIVAPIIAERDGAVSERDRLLEMINEERNIVRKMKSEIMGIMDGGV
jgi:hypothetical protein